MGKLKVQNLFPILSLITLTFMVMISESKDVLCYNYQLSFKLGRSKSNDEDDYRIISNIPYMKVFLDIFQGIPPSKVAIKMSDKSLENAGLGKIFKATLSGITYDFCMDYDKRHETKIMFSLLQNSNKNSRVLLKYSRIPLIYVDKAIGFAKKIKDLDIDKKGGEFSLNSKLTPFQIFVSVCFFFGLTWFAQICCYCANHKALEQQALHLYLNQIMLIQGTQVAYSEHSLSHMTSTKIIEALESIENELSQNPPKNDGNTSKSWEILDILDKLNTEAENVLAMGFGHIDKMDIVWALIYFGVAIFFYIKMMENLENLVV